MHEPSLSGVEKDGGRECGGRGRRGSGGGDRGCFGLGLSRGEKFKELDGARSRYGGPLVLWLMQINSLLYMSIFVSKTLRRL